ncbi:MAG: protein phosphatase 2C domain-containing protein [Aliidongia sp.]
MDPTVRQERAQPPGPSGPRLESAGRTHVGKVRKVNEDAFLDRPDIELWAVADGVGGWHAGDRASGLVVELLGGLGSDCSGAALLAAVREQLDRANAQLLQEAEETGRPSATTVVVMMSSGRHFACVWAGDSRLYLWRAGQLQQLSRDHTEAQALVDAGLMTLEEAERQTNRNAIARAVGATEILELEMLQAGLEDGDVFLLCTDGLTKMLSDEEIATALAWAAPKTVVEMLVDQSLDRGAIDNVTVVAIRFGQVAPPAAPSP